MIHSTAAAPSHSRLSCVHDCERKYFYRYILRISGKVDFPPAYAGSALHTAFDAWHRTGNAEVAQAALSEAWGRKTFHGDWAWLTAGHASIVLDNYIRSKHTADWDVVRLGPADLSSRLRQTDAACDAAGFFMLAEASFIIEVPELDGLLNLRPDLLLNTASGLQVVDHKTTTAYLGSKLYNGAKYSHQLRLYCLGLAALLSKPVLQAGINGVYTGKTASSPSFRGQRFDYYTFDFSAADLEETVAWYHVGRNRMLHMEEHFTEADELAAPQNPGAQCGYCEYNTLCSAPKALRPGLVKLEYRRKEAA